MSTSRHKIPATTEMPSNSRLPSIVSLLFLAALATGSSEIPIQVLTPEGGPVDGLVLAQGRDGPVAPATDAEGRTRLPVVAGEEDGRWIALDVRQPVVKAGSWIVLRPWNRLLPPTYGRDSEQGPIEIIVGRVSSPSILDTGVGLEGVTANVLARLDRGGPTRGAMTTEERQQLIATEAARFGLAPEAMDAAIRGWQPKSGEGFWRGLVALYTEHYEEATELLEEVRQQAEQTAQPDPASITDAAFFLAYGLSQQDRFDEAANVLKRARALRSDDPTILLALGRALHRAGDFEAAEEVLQRDLELRQSTLGPEHLEVAAALSNLGVVKFESGRIVEARQLYERALAIDEEALGPNDPIVAADLFKLALVMDLQGRDRRAEELFHRVLEILDSTPEPPHPDLAQSLATYAYFLHRNGRWQEAEPLYQRAVGILDSTTNADPLLVATTLRHLAMLYQKQERLGEAEPLYRRALILFDQVDPKEPEIVLLHCSLSDLLECTDRPAEAKELEARANAIRSRTD